MRRVKILQKYLVRREYRNLNFLYFIDEEIRDLEKLYFEMNDLINKICKIEVRELNMVLKNIV